MYRRLTTYAAVLIMTISACTKNQSPASNNVTEQELTFVQSIQQYDNILTKGYVKGTSLYETTTARSTDTTPRQLITTAHLYPQDEQEYDYLTDEVFIYKSDNWKHEPPIYWPLESRMDFLFWSTGTPLTIVEHAAENGALGARMTISEAYLQDDILFGSLWQQGDISTLNVNMKHAQAWITIALRNTGTDTIRITNVVLLDVFTDGVLEILNNEGNAQFNWYFNSSTAKNHSLVDNGNVYGKTLSDEYVYLDLLLPEQDKKDLSIFYTSNGTDTVKTFNLSHSRWLAGNNYKYEFNFKSTTHE